MLMLTLLGQTGSPFNSPAAFNVDIDAEGRTIGLF